MVASKQLETIRSQTNSFTFPLRECIILIMQPFNLNILEEALTILGEALKERKQRVSLAVIGGSVLLLQDYITRPTRDIDVVALLDEDGNYKSATPLPDFLIECKNEVADFLGLDHHWLNRLRVTILQMVFVKWQLKPLNFLE